MFGMNGIFSAMIISNFFDFCTVSNVTSSTAGRSLSIVCATVSASLIWKSAPDSLKYGYIPLDR